jgi:hypothetical protein
MSTYRWVIFVWLLAGLQVSSAGCAGAGPQAAPAPLDPRAADDFAGDFQAVQLGDNALDVKRSLAHSANVIETADGLELHSSAQEISYVVWGVSGLDSTDGGPLWIPGGGTQIVSGDLGRFSMQVAPLAAGGRVTLGGSALLLTALPPQPGDWSGWRWAWDEPRAPEAGIVHHWCDMWFTHGGQGYLAIVASGGAAVEISDLSFLWDFAAYPAG